MSNNNSTTNGNSRAYVSKLLDKTRDAIDLAYHDGADGSETDVLRDWARDIGHTDRIEALIEKEMQNERGHRRFGANFTDGRATYSITVKHAAILLVLGNIGDGAARTAPVTAEMFMTLRPGCAEAMQVGYLSRAFLAPYVEQLRALDYAEAVK